LCGAADEEQHECKEDPAHGADRTGMRTKRLSLRQSLLVLIGTGS
jgi:hypothetical protein